MIEKKTRTTFTTIHTTYIYIVYIYISNLCVGLYCALECVADGHKKRETLINGWFV